MTARQFKNTLTKVGWSQRAFAREVVHTNERTVRNWCSGRSKVPGSVVSLLRAMLALKDKN